MTVPSVEERGFLVVPGVLSPSQCDELTGAISSHIDGRAGSRNLMDQAWCRDLAISLKKDSRVSVELPESAVAVQCTLFDKSQETNWLVAFHQDLSIPVQERVSSAECSAWSLKEGVTFVQPPTQVLAGLLAVRVHLDDCRADNGPLRVVPGSHRYGRLTREQVRTHRSAGEVACTVSRGGALLMRPLLLHASSKSVVDVPRRVLHFLFGPSVLPYGLRWHHAV